MKAFIAAAGAAVLTWFVVGSIPNLLGNTGGWAALFILIIGPIAGYNVFGVVIVHFARLEAAEEQLRRDAALREAEAQRERELELTRLRELRQLCLEAQETALSVPAVLAGADLDLDRAEHELDEGLYSPFWEAMEDATAQLNRFDQGLQYIASRRSLHAEKGKLLGTRAEVLTLSDVLLPDPEPTNSRLRALYRRAQKDGQFANIYEQRRIAAKVDQTNAILIAGFTSLGDAVQRLGDRITETIQNLSETMDVRLGDLQESLESAVAAAAIQREALLKEARDSRGLQESVLHQMRKDADRRSEHEREARQMLNNLQRRRDPVTGFRYRGR
jgi:hypothetical protein